MNKYILKLPDDDDLIGCKSVQVSVVLVECLGHGFG